METIFEASLLVQLLAGVGLAAACGLRAFLPPLVVGLLARWDLVDLRGGLDWLASDAALVVFGSAVLLEILADKVPLVDHILDVAGTVLKPATGALMLGAALVDLPPLAAAVVGLVLGGTVAGGVHLSRAGLRLASTGTTSGLANPVLSAAEDGLSLGGTLLAIFAPLLLIALLVAALLLLRRVVRWLGSRARQVPA